MTLGAGEAFKARGSNVRRPERGSWSNTTPIFQIPQPKGIQPADGPNAKYGTSCNISEHLLMCAPKEGFTDDDAVFPRGRKSYC